MSPDRLWKMQEAMDYCNIASRSTFYKRLEEWQLAGLPTPYVNINPAGKYATRRFKPDLVQQCVERFPEKISALQKESSGQVQN